MPTYHAPKYRRQRSPSGDRAFVELNGVRQYLGSYDSEESKTAYHRVLKATLCPGCAGLGVALASDVMTGDCGVGPTIAEARAVRASDSPWTCNSGSRDHW